MAGFQETFGEATILYSDNYKWLAITAEKSIEEVVEIFTFEAMRPVSVDEIKVDYVKFGFSPTADHRRSCWHTGGYNGTGQGEKKVWTLEF